MTKLNIRADQVCVGDILNGREVLDLEVNGDLVNLCMINPDTEMVTVRGYDRDKEVEVDTDYLDRIFSEWDAEDVNVDVEDVPDVDFGEDVEDLLDH